MTPGIKGDDIIKKKMFTLITGSVLLIIFLVNILKFENKLVSLPQKIINNEMARQTRMTNRFLADSSELKMVRSAQILLTCYRRKARTDHVVEVPYHSSSLPISHVRNSSMGMPPEPIRKE